MESFSTWIGTRTDQTDGGVQNEFVRIQSERVFSSSLSYCLVLFTYSPGGSSTKNHFAETDSSLQKEKEKQ